MPTDFTKKEVAYNTNNKLLISSILWCNKKKFRKGVDYRKKKMYDQILCLQKCCAGVRKIWTSHPIHATCTRASFCDLNSSFW